MNYFYADANNQPQGPHDLAQLEQLRANGTLTDATRVIPVDGKEWKPLAHVLAVAKLPPLPPPILPVPPATTPPPTVMPVPPPAPPKCDSTNIPAQPNSDHATSAPSTQNASQQPEQKVNIQEVCEGCGLTLSISDSQIRTDTETVMIADIQGVHIVEDGKLMGRWGLWVLCLLPAWGCMFGGKWVGITIGGVIGYLSYPYVLGGYNVFVSTPAGRTKIVHLWYFSPGCDGGMCKSGERAYGLAKTVSDAISDTLAVYRASKTDAG